MQNEITNKVKAILTIAGKKNIDYANKLGITRQSMSNKMQRGYYTMDDMIHLAECTDAEIIIRIKGIDIRIGSECLQSEK